MEEIRVYVCKFRRNSSSRFEKGIKIGEEGPIIDKNGNIVKSVYMCISCFEDGCFIF